MTVGTPESNGKRNLNVDGEIKTIAEVSKGTGWLLENLQQYEKTGEIDKMKNMVVLIGANDLGGGKSAQQIFDNIQKIWDIGKKHGIKVYACTLPPFKGWKNYQAKFNEINDRRVELNTLIMSSGTPEKVIRLNEIMADQNDSDALASNFDSGDHLHPKKTPTARLWESEIGERKPDRQTA
jgi:hypothetical protein